MAEERPVDRLARARLKAAKVTLWIVGGCLAVLLALVAFFILVALFGWVLL